MFDIFFIGSRAYEQKIDVMELRYLKNFRISEFRLLSGGVVQARTRVVRVREAEVRFWMKLRFFLSVEVWSCPGICPRVFQARTSVSGCMWQNVNFLILSQIFMESHPGVCPGEA